MAEDLDITPEEEDKDKHSTILRGASTAGLFVTAYKFPSIWRTLSKYYPRGTVGSLISKYIKAEPTPLEVVAMIHKNVSDKYNNPEYVANVFVDNIKKSDARSREQDIVLSAAERVRETISGQKLKEQMESVVSQTDVDNIPLSEVTKKIRDLETGIIDYGKSGVGPIKLVPNIKKENVLREIRKFTLIDFLNETKMSDISSTHPTLIQYLTDQSQNIPNESIDILFESIISSEKTQDKGLALRYLSRLQNRSYVSTIKNFNTIPTNTMDILARKAIRPTNKPDRLVRLDTSDVKPFIPEAIKLNDKPLVYQYLGGKVLSSKSQKEAELQIAMDTMGLDRFVDSTVQVFPWIKKEVGGGAPYVSTALELRGLTRDLQNEVVSWNKNQPAESHINFALRLEHSDVTKTYGQVAVTLGQGRRQETFYLPLADVTGKFMHPSAHSLRVNGLPVINDTLRTTTGAYLGYLRRNINHMIRDFAGAHTSSNKLIGLIKSSSEMLLNYSERVEGNEFRNRAATKKLHFLDQEDIFRKGGKALRRRIPKYADWQLRKAVKRSGRDVVIYDTEYFGLDRYGKTSHAGAPVRANNPAQTQVWQIAYKRMSATDEYISHDVLYLADEEFKRQLDAKSGNLWEAFVNTAKQTGKGDDYIEQNRQILIKRGQDPKMVMKHLQEQWRGTAKVDYFGSGADRQILNFLSKQSGVGTLVEKGEAIDVYNMMKFFTSSNIGGSLKTQFEYYVNKSSMPILEKVKKLILGGKEGNMAAGGFGSEILSGLKTTGNLRQALIRAYTATAHDAQSDIAATHAVLTMMTDSHPIMGNEGTFQSFMDRLLFQSFVGSGDKIAAANNAFLSRHWIGTGKKGFRHYPFGVSVGSLEKAKSSLEPTYLYDVWGIGASFQKQEAQLYHGLTLRMANSSGRRKSIQNAGLEKLGASLGKNAIAESVQRNATPTLLKTAFVFKGSALSSQGAVLMDESISKRLFTEVTGEVNRFDITGSMEDITLGGDLKNIYAKAKRYQRRFKEADPKLKDINECIRIVISKENRDLEKINERLELESGSLESNVDEILSSKYKVHGDTIVAENKMGGKVFHRINPHRKSRTTFLSIYADKENKNKLIVTHQMSHMALLSDQDSPFKVVLPGYGRGTVSKIRNLGSIIKDTGDKVNDSNLYNKGIELVTTLRDDAGSIKKAQFNRIYESLLESGRRSEADQLARETFHGLNYTSDKLGSIILHYGNTERDAEAAVEMSNKFTGANMFKWMKKADRVWDTKSVSIHAKILGISLTHDMNTDKLAFDEVVEREFSKVRKSHKLIRSANGQPIDEEAMTLQKRFLRAQLNPYFDIEKDNYFDYKTQKIGRFFDMLEYTRDAKGGVSYEHGIVSWGDPRLSHEFEASAKPTANKQRLRLSEFAWERMQRSFGIHQSGPQKYLISQTQGVYRKKAREHVQDFIDIFISGKIAKGKYATIGDLSEPVTNLHKMREFNNINTKTVKASKFFRKSKVPENFDVDTAKLELRKLNEELSKNIPEMERDIILEKIDDLKKNISGRRSLDFKGKGAKLDVDSLLGTIWETFDKSQKDQVGGHFKDTALVDFGKDLDGKRIKVAPYDMILIHTPGFSPLSSNEFMESVVSRVESNLAKDSRRNPQMAEEIRQKIQLMRNLMNTAKSTIDGLPMPSPQAMREIANASVLGNNTYIHRKKIMSAYENVLIAANNVIHAKASDKSVSKYITRFSDFFSLFLHESSSKKGVIATSKQLFLEGQMGKALSQDAMYRSVLSNWSKLNEGGKPGAIGKLTVKIRRQYPNKTEQQIAELATQEYQKSFRTMKLLKDPFASVMTRTDLERSEIHGMKFKDWFFSDLMEGKKTEKEKLYQKIMDGKAAIPVAFGRFPHERSLESMTTSLGYVIDPDLEIFKGMQKGGLPLGPLLLHMLSGDADGDDVYRHMYHATSVSQFNQIQKNFRFHHSNRAKVMSEFTTRALKLGSFEEARKQILDEISVKNSSGLGIEEANQFMEVAHAIAEDSKVGLVERRNKKGMLRGYSLKSFDNEEALKLALSHGFTNNSEVLGSLAKGETLQDIYTRQIRASRNMYTSKIVIGDITATVHKKMIAIDKMLATVNKHGTEDLFDKLQSDLKVNPGKTIGREGLEESLKVAKSKFQSFYDKMNFIFYKHPELAIGGKHLTGIDRMEDLMLLAESIKDLNNPRSQQITGRTIFKDENRQTIKMLEDVDVAVRYRMQDKLFASQVDKEYSYMSRKGPGSYTALQEGFERLIGRNIKDASPKEQVEFLDNYFKTYGIGEDTMAKRSSRNWSNSIKQMLWGREGKDPSKEFLLPKESKIYSMGKYAYEHNLGKKGLLAFAALGLVNFLNPDQLSGGISDLGMDLGQKPGRGSEFNDFFGFNTSPAAKVLNPGPKVIDPFSERFARLVADDPRLQERQTPVGSYKDLSFSANLSKYVNTQNTSKRRYIDKKKKFSRRYKTSDMTSVERTGNFQWPN